MRLGGQEFIVEGSIRNDATLGAALKHQLQFLCLFFFKHSNQNILALSVYKISGFISVELYFLIYV
jgi:hypothetical protein